MSDWEPCHLRNMTMANVLTDRIADVALIHPVCRQDYLQLEAYLHKAFLAGVTKSNFVIFETYRHPLRQRMLCDVAKTSKAREFQSPHQFGLAVDFVPFHEKWSWDQAHDWAFLRKSAERFGLAVPIRWDLVHVEHPAWKHVLEVCK